MRGSGRIIIKENSPKQPSISQQYDTILLYTVHKQMASFLTLYYTTCDIMCTILSHLKRFKYTAIIFTFYLLWSVLVLWKTFKSIKKIKLV